MIARRQGRRALALPAAVFVVVALAAPATSAAAAGTQQERDVCQADVFRLCMVDIPDETRIVACLNERSADLSPGCRLVIDPPPRKRSKG